MYAVLVPTNVNAGILNPGQASPQGETLIYTRRGRRYRNVKPAEALARRYLGKVVDVNTNRVVRDFL